MWGIPFSDSFLPLAEEVFGCLHPPFDVLLHQAVRDLLTTSNSLLSILATQLFQKILTTLH